MTVQYIINVVGEDMAVKKFLKVDSEKGYLDHKDDINYFATNQMRRVAFGGMLGDFDENGFYVINQKIVEELIKMPKVIVDIVDGADLIRSKVKFDGFYHFILTVEENKATFSLLEKLQYQSNRNFNSGSYSDINEYIIDEMIIPDKDFDRNVLYQKYNISTERNEDVLSIEDMDELTRALYFNIVEKIKINYLVKNELIMKEKQIEAVEADYFEGVLAVMSEFPELDGKVKAEIKQELGEKYNFVIINRPFFQKTINEILDSCIDMYIQDLSPEQRNEFLIKFRAVKATFYSKFKQLIPVEVQHSASVRFNPNQTQEETIIGTLSKEVVTKGFTSSDIRRVVVNDDELQLSVQKIKEIVQENEKLCTANNANGNMITRGRKLAKEFYTDLEEEGVDLLKPRGEMVKDAIVENVSRRQEPVAETKVETDVDNDAAAEVAQESMASAKSNGVKSSTSVRTDAASSRPNPTGGTGGKFSATVQNSRDEARAGGQQGRASGKSGDVSTGYGDYGYYDSATAKEDDRRRGLRRFMQAGLDLNEERSAGAEGARRDAEEGTDLSDDESAERKAVKASQTIGDMEL